MAEHRYGKKEYLALGRILVRRRPDLAAELLPLSNQQNNQTDRSLIPKLFESFCNLYNCQPADLRGKLKKATQHKHRRIFISVVLYFYAVEVYSHPPSSPVIPIGLSKSLAECLVIKKAAISILIRNVLNDYRNYEDFSNEVQSLVSSLKIIIDGHTEQN